MGNILCDGSPVENDPRIALSAREWESSMMRACCNNPAGCALAIFCPPCYAYHLRQRALNFDMTKYKCCQGYICPSCTSACCPGQDTCPGFCLCLEVFLCESLAISTTRIYVQDERQIVTDPCDNRIIRFNNCMQLLSCICDILAIFYRDLRAVARLIDLLADIVYCLVQACMQAQTAHELDMHPTAADYGPAGSGAVVSDRAALISGSNAPDYSRGQPPGYTATVVKDAPRPYGQ